MTTYNERFEFVEEYINHWSTLADCTPIENGFKCLGCSAIFIEDNFNIHFGFYDPDGQKLAEYLFNTETGIALMICDQRYSGCRNDYTGVLADILGGLIAKQFKLINKPMFVYTDSPKPMSFKDVLTEAIRKIIEEEDKGNT